jgi:hypothetical protein
MPGVTVADQRLICRALSEWADEQDKLAVTAGRMESSEMAAVYAGARDRASRLAEIFAPGCRCGIAPGAPHEVIPLACPVHGTPCGSCGEIDGCEEDCDG